MRGEKEAARHEVRTDSGEVVVRTNRCLRKLITPESHVFLALWGHYRRGVLPYGGGLLDQPAPFVEAMGILDANVTVKPGG